MGAVQRTDSSACSASSARTEWLFSPSLSAVGGFSLDAMWVGRLEAAWRVKVNRMVRGDVAMWE